MKTEEFYKSMDDLNDQYLLEAMEYHAEKQKVIPYLKSFRIWAAACIALVLAIPVSAEIFYGTISNMLAPLYGTQTELAETLGTPIGESIELGEYTLTADAAIGDKYSLAIVYTLRRSDGQPMEKPLCFQRARPSNSSSTECSTIYSPSDDGRKVNIIQKWSLARKRYQNQKISVTFRNLAELYNDQSFSKKPVIPGTWTLKFPVKYEDSSVELLSEPLTIDDYQGVRYSFRKIEVSPVGIYMDLNVERIGYDFQPVLSNILSVQEAGKIGRLLVPCQLRRSMNLFDMSIMCMETGTEVEILRTENIGGVEWAQVQIIGTETIGWVSSEAYLYLFVDGLLCDDAEIRLKDGSITKLNLSHTAFAGYSTADKDGGVKKSTMFDMPIALSNMDALIICGQEIPIHVD